MLLLAGITKEKIIIVFIQELLNQDNEVIVIDDLSTGKKDNLPKHNNLTFIQKSICDGDIGKILKNVDAVYHLAALPRVQFSIQEPLKTNQANMVGTLNLLNSCRENNVKRFVFSSSSSVYGDNHIPYVETMTPRPMSPYALQKLTGEHYCRLYHDIHGLETVSLRYFNVFGPKQDPDAGYAQMIPKFIKMVHNNQQPTIFGDGKKTRDFTFVSDIVRANILAGTTHNKEVFGQIFNIGPGKNISVNDAAYKIIKMVRRDLKPLYLPAVIEPQDMLADNSKARKILSWKPEISFDEGLKILYDSLLKKDL